MNPHLDELISLCRHPKIQERRGEWLPADIHVDKYGIVRHVSNTDLYGDEDGERTFDNNTWLPPLSDPLRPERSLMGMLGEKKIGIEIGNNRLWYCNISAGYAVTGEIVFDSFPGPTPEIAVCKAVIAQREEGK